jgi:hypothetical protein
MSAVGANNPTLIDLATRLEDGKIAKAIVEILNLTNEILDDQVWVEANDGSAHKTTIRSGLPSATWRQLNYGVQPSKSTTVQIKDACGMLENYAEVDKSLADLHGNSSDFRMSEDRAFIEGMNQSYLSTLFYGNTASNSERFMGFAPRFNSLSAENASNILTGGGSSSDNTSVWLVVWGPNTVHGIYPNGSKAGLSMRDLGEQTLYDTQTPQGRYQGYRSHYKWDCGLTVRDWRYVVRIPNISVGALTKAASSGADLVDLMVQAIELIPALGMGTPVFYCNRTVRSFLRRQIANKANLALSLDQVGGKTIMNLDGIPVKKCDSLLNTEAVVS